MRVARQTIGKQAHVCRSPRIRVITERHVAHPARQLRAEDDKIRDGSSIDFGAEKNRDLLFRFELRLELHELLSKFSRKRLLPVGQPAHCGGFLTCLDLQELL